MADKDTDQETQDKETLKPGSSSDAGGAASVTMTKVEYDASLAKAGDDARTAAGRTTESLDQRERALDARDVRFNTALAQATAAGDTDAFDKLRQDIDKDKSDATTAAEKRDLEEREAAVTTAQALIAGTAHEQLVARVATEANVDSKALLSLGGTTEAELKANAAKLKPLGEPPKGIKPDAGTGSGGAVIDITKSGGQLIRDGLEALHK